MNELHNLANKRSTAISSITYAHILCLFYTINKSMRTIELNIFMF